MSKRTALCVGYQPVVFESLGGVTGEAEQVLSSLCRLVADNTNTPYVEVAHRFWQRVSVDLQRAGHRAFARRVGGTNVGGRTQAGSLLEAVEGLRGGVMV